MAITAAAEVVPSPPERRAGSLLETLMDTFPERKLPRDGIDFRLAVPLMAWLMAAFVAVPWAVAYGGLRWYGVSSDWAAFLSPFVGLAVLIDVCLLVWLPAFRSATADRDGLLFRRYAGPPKRVFWESLVRVREASRAEVFFRVWLWPGFPPRGSVLCGSSKHQFRIEWDGGGYYFAPADVAGLLEAVRLRRPDVVIGVRHDET